MHFSLRFEPPFLIVNNYCRSRKLYCLIYLCEIEKPDFILWIPHTNTCTKAYLGYIYLLFSLLCSSYIPSALNSTSDIAKLPINSLINTNLLFHLLGNKKYFIHFFSSISSFISLMFMFPFRCLPCWNCNVDIWHGPVWAIYQQCFSRCSSWAWSCPQSFFTVWDVCFKGITALLEQSSDPLHAFFLQFISS